MKTKKIPAKTIKLNKYTIIMDAIESGVLLGYRRAHKHTDSPEEDNVVHHVMNDIAAQLSDVIDWER